MMCIWTLRTNILHLGDELCDFIDLSDSVPILSQLFEIAFLTERCRAFLKELRNRLFRVFHVFKKTKIYELFKNRLTL